MSDQQLKHVVVIVEYLVRLRLFDHVPYRLLVDRQQVIVTFGELEDLVSLTSIPSNQTSLEGELEQLAHLRVIVVLALPEIR